VSEHPVPAESRADEIASLLVRVYEIHEVIIAETGGLPGLREAGLLHASVARPFAAFGGEDLYPSLFEPTWTGSIARISISPLAQ